LKEIIEIFFRRGKYFKNFNIIISLVLKKSFFLRHAILLGKKAVNAFYDGSFLHMNLFLPFIFKASALASKISWLLSESPATTRVTRLPNMLLTSSAVSGKQCGITMVTKEGSVSSEMGEMARRRSLDGAE
jgi:hypothetical protein